MTWTGSGNGNNQLCDVIPRFLPANEISGINWHYVAFHVLYCSFHIHGMVNLFMFLGN